MNKRWIAWNALTSRLGAHLAYIGFTSFTPCIDFQILFGFNILYGTFILCTLFYIKISLLCIINKNLFHIYEFFVYWFCFSIVMLHLKPLRSILLFIHFYNWGGDIFPHFTLLISSVHHSLLIHCKCTTVFRSSDDIHLRYIHLF